MATGEDPAGQEFARRTRELLEDSAGNVGAHARSRLTQARHAALEQRGAKYPAGWQRWLPAGATAAAVLAMVLIFGRDPATPVPQLAAGSGTEDLELLADTDALAIAQEQDVDYDFYEWAVSAADAEPRAASGS
jgi:hypothetical protein